MPNGALIHPNVEPDRVSPSIEGYFRLPAVWVGESPEPQSVLTLNANVHNQVVFEQSLSCGIKTYVQRDGTVLFDFSSWNLAPQVIILGYQKPGLRVPYTVPKETTRAENKAERYAVIRAQVMNVHQACLVTSERVVKRRSAQMGFPVTAWQTLKGINVSSASHYRQNPENMRDIARNFLNNRHNISMDHPIQRRVIELDVLEHSMNLLDMILDSNEVILIQMIEAIYLATFRFYENRFGESITLAWGVCEQLISSIWATMLDDIRDDNRMPRTRRKQLVSRDYTASVISEILEINGLIDYDLLRLLNKVRKSRNKWSHEMKEPEEREVHDSIKVSQSLLERTKGIRLELYPSRTGAVPQWNVRYGSGH